MRKTADPSRDLPPGQIEVQALYSIATLANFARTTRFRMGRLLDSYGVRRVRSGRIWLVPLSEIEDRLPLLFSSIESAVRLQNRANEK